MAEHFSLNLENVSFPDLPPVNASQASWLGTSWAWPWQSNRDIDRPYTPWSDWLPSAESLGDVVGTGGALFKQFTPELTAENAKTAGTAVGGVGALGGIRLVVAKAMAKPDGKQAALIASRKRKKREKKREAI